MTPDRPHHTPQGPSRSRFHRLEGAALIIVLSCLVLVTALLIGFLSRAQTERGNSASYRGGMGSRNLADYAVNIVMAQIRAATTGTNAANAWASQPGAIRVYSSTGANLVGIYKLYSATNNMVGSSVSDLMSDTTPSGWAANTALYTDLNAPVITGSGAGAVTNYPILDPAALGIVQGFTNEIVTGVNSATNPVPMPVTWLYVLEDGTLVAPVVGPSNSVTVTGATSNNPITGRIAFWTDDDTCKININTASGAPWNYTNTTVTTTWAGNMTTRTPANYWDTPVIASAQDINFAIAQPWAAEYQRYPGHPATVSLSAVLTNLSTNDIMAIAPRITYQNAGSNIGSQWGGVVTENAPATNSWASLTIVNPGINLAFRIQDDASRLYANVDELLYATNRSATGTNPVTPSQLEQARFFLTASSRAPDVTLFNTPRLLCWPITYTTNSTPTGNTNKITPYDRVIAFCGTVGANTNYGSTNSYYFTRWDPSSPIADYNTNSRLLGYLRRMTMAAVPGFAGSSGILGKYGATEAEQITTEIFDYIRCINTQDMCMASNATTSFTNQYTYATNNGIVPTIGTNNTRGFGRFPTITKVGMVFWFNNYFTNAVTNTFTNGAVTNTQTNTITNVSICARLIMEPFYASHGHPSPSTSSSYRINVSGMTSFRWGTNSLDTAPIFTINTNSFSFFSVGRPYGGRVAFENVPSTGFIATSVTNSTAARFFNSQTTNVITNSANPAQTVPYTNSTFYFSGGTLRFTITDTATNTIQTIDVNMPAITNLPVPLDSYTTNWIGTSYPQTTVSFNGPNAWTSGTFTWANGVDSTKTATNSGRVVQEANVRFRPEDVVRAVGVVHGDYRLIAANRSVTTNSYVPILGGTNAYYSADPNQRLAHNFVGEYPYSAAGGRFLKSNYYTLGTTYTEGRTNSLSGEFGHLTNSTAPPVNFFTNGWYTHVNGDAASNTTTSVTGDFDNGYGAAGDGPYIGFPDEGNARVLQFRYPPPNDASIVFATPYLDGSGATLPAGGGFFSPNRLVPSAGIMGSLPTGVISQTPWQTLLFRPAALTSSTHPGLNNPPDYLLLDLFNMPVVEPYAISEPLSTAGRVNMNYQILPFTYIKRSTAVQAALHTEWITAIPIGRVTDAGRKSGGPGTSSATLNSRNSRWPLNLSTTNGTLVGFEQRFGSNDIFRSAAEICSILLVPTNSTWSAVTGGSFWPNYSLTGDNSKERPYARIYPKLTTKSNTYTVHYRVEVLKKRPNSTPATWTEGQDKVLSTYRGSTTIERYVNPRDTSLPDYATLTIPVTGTNALPNFYKFRVAGERQFNP